MSKTQNVSLSFMGDPGIHGEKLIYPAASRNQEPILEVLKRFLIFDETPKSPTFLEIGSGSGQHIAHFAPQFPGIKFQPTEVDPSLLGSITHYAEACPTKNINFPFMFDVRGNLADCGFKANSIDFIYCSNLIHISPYACTIGLFRNAGAHLKRDALLITYGPFSKDGVIEPESNVSFDASLRSRDPEWGLRDITELIKLAEENKLSLIDTVEMPANNKTLIWKKD